MELLNWIVDEEGDVQGYISGGEVLLIDDVSPKHSIVPSEHGEVGHGFDFKWDTAPTVRHVLNYRFYCIDSGWC